MYRGKKKSIHSFKKQKIQQKLDMKRIGNDMTAAQKNEWSG